MLHELSQPSGGTVSYRDTRGIGDTLDHCPGQLRMERSDKQRHLLQQDGQGGKAAGQRESDKILIRLFG